jgi:hypothetical protein
MGTLYPDDDAVGMALEVVVTVEVVILLVLASSSVDQLPR